jgi:hypothetical protein
MKKQPLLSFQPLLVLMIQLLLKTQLLSRYQLLSRTQLLLKAQLSQLRRLDKAVNMGNRRQRRLEEGGEAGGWERMGRVPLTQLQMLQLSRLAEGHTGLARKLVADTNEL